MIGPKDLKFNPASLDSPMLLVDVAPAYAYEGVRRTDTVVGYKYTVCFPAHKMKKLGIKIEGPQQMAAPDEAVEVAFLKGKILPGGAHGPKRLVLPF